MLKLIGLLPLLSSIYIAHSSNDSLSLNYTLEYWRDGNAVYMYCVTVKPSRNTVKFRINETEPVYFVSKKSYRASPDKIKIVPSPFSELNLDLVKFTLQPQYEGIYFCGDPITNSWSLGVGPLVANPTLVEVNNNSTRQIIETTNGENATMVCPVQLGKLGTYYFVQWLFYDGEWKSVNNMSRKFTEYSGEFSSLTILHVQDKDYRHYACRVTVKDPVNGYTWTMDKYVEIRNKFDWKLKLRQSFHSLGWHFVLNVTIFSFCICQCCVRHLRYYKPNICRKYFMVEIGSQGTTNAETCTLKSQVSQFGTEYFIDGLHLFKEERIGIGVFGTTYRGTYKGRICAAKMLTHHAQFHMAGMKGQSEAQETLRKFLDKCKFLEKQSHSNIVQHIATVVDPTSSLPIFVMELMDCSIKSYLEKCKPKKMPSIFQMSIFLDISKGLSFLHSKNIIHCDLCDDNVLLDMRCNTPRAKISDFSLSTVISYDDMNSELIALEHRQNYYPPEEVIHHANYNEATDIYALGVLGIQIALTETHIEDSARNIVSQLPESSLLKNIIMACLQKTNQPYSKEVVNMILSLKQ